MPIFRTRWVLRTPYVVSNALYKSQCERASHRQAERSPSLPGRRVVQDGVSRLRRWYAAVPLWLKIILGVVLLVAVPELAVLAIVAGLIYAPYALSTSVRSVWASLSVALWGLVAVFLFANAHTAPRYLLTLLPLVVAGLAHVGPLGPPDRALPDRGLDAGVVAAGRHPGLPAARPATPTSGPRWPGSSPCWSSAAG